MFGAKGSGRARVFTTEEDAEDIPIAEGAFWLFAPLAIVLATGALVSLVLGALDQTVSPTFAPALDLYRAFAQPPALAAFGWLHAVAPSWKPPGWSVDIYVLSFAGGAYIAAFTSSTAARGMGALAGFLAMIALALFLGATLLGFGFLYIAADSFFGFGGKDRGDNTTTIALVAPIVLAAAFLIANAVAT